MKYPDGGWLDGLYYTAFDMSSTISDWVQSNVTRGFMSVYYANGVWVAGCTGTKGLYYSTDGMTWTQSNVTSGFQCIYYANGLWVAGNVGDSKGLYYSTDGMTWTQSNVTSGDFYYNSVYYANGLWVGASRTSGSGLYYSKITQKTLTLTI